MTKKKHVGHNFKEVKTTIIGSLLWVITGIYFFLPYFSDRELWIAEHYEVMSGFIGGLLLMLAPDRFVDFLFTWLNRKK